VPKIWMCGQRSLPQAQTPQDSRVDLWARHTCRTDKKDLDLWARLTATITHPAQWWICGHGSLPREGRHGSLLQKAQALDSLPHEGLSAIDLDVWAQFIASGSNSSRLKCGSVGTAHTPRRQQRSGSVGTAHCHNHTCSPVVDLWARLSATQGAPRTWMSSPIGTNC
jgi:hypothetical protein